MKLLKKVLVAMERDESSRQALQVAASWVRAFDADLLIVHVLPDINILPEARNFAARIEALRTDADKEMVNWEQEARDAGVSHVETEVRQGVIHEEISRSAANAGASLIICGAGDRRDGYHHRLGTNAERLVRYAEKPVLVQCAEPRPAPRVILCPVDMSETSARALRNALYIASAFDAELIALFVNYHFPSVTSLSTHLAHEIMADWDKLREQDFSRFLSGFDLAGVKFRREIREGKADEQIIAAVADFKVDLTVMGSVGRTGLARLFLGSVAQKVVREMPCSIMTVKQENLLAVDLIEEVREIERHYRNGLELLKSGDAEEAKLEFAFCLSRDQLYAPAWEGMAAAAEMTGDGNEAREARERAEIIRNTIWNIAISDDSRKKEGRAPRRKPAAGKHGTG